MCRPQGYLQREKSQQPYRLVFFAGKTEPKRLSLVSNDSSQLKGFIAVVPFPNETTDKGCRLESIIGTPKGEVTYVQGSGFEPNEELIMILRATARRITAPLRLRLTAPIRSGNA